MVQGLGGLWGAGGLGFRVPISESPRVVLMIICTHTHIYIYTYIHGGPYRGSP